MLDMVPFTETEMTLFGPRKLRDSYHNTYANYVLELKQQSPRRCSLAVFKVYLKKHGRMLLCFMMHVIQQTPLLPGSPRLVALQKLIAACGFEATDPGPGRTRSRRP
jgi:hypothetical protein